MTGPRRARGAASATLVLVLLAVSACGERRDRPGANRSEGGSVPRQIEGRNGSTFAALIERLSEPGGYFDTDNLISNEASYLHVMGELDALAVRGGAYIGVGPDQNFSYIARIRPEIAFILDIRRDNLLQHLLFKALFEEAETRIEYLSLLFGRPPPSPVDRWSERPLEELLDYIDGTAVEARIGGELWSRLARTVRSFGVPLDDDDLATIERIHATFVRAGPDLKFSSHGRAPLPEYPTYRRLLLERDLDGRRASYLARERDFRFVKMLQDRDRIIPVVGDFAGGHALRAIGRAVAQRGHRVSAFYTSNVELYLIRDGSFERFANNVAALPRDNSSVIIRSYFNRWYRHPEAVPGYVSTQLIQPIDEFLAGFRAGEYRNYRDLVMERAPARR